VIKIVETRVFRWTAPGYEDSFTQYQIAEDGQLAISQISLRDNTSRALQNFPVIRKFGDADLARSVMTQLIESRSDGYEEVLP